MKKITGLSLFSGVDVARMAFDGTGVLAKFYTEVNLQSAIDMRGGML